MSHAVSVATRHVMQANRSTDTKPELLVRRRLREAGLPGYRLHWKGAAGRPDICYPGRKVAVFVNGCYWHRCPHCALPLPRTNVEFWSDKFARNRSRDERDHRALVSEGWTVLVVWECRLRDARLDGTMRDLVREVTMASGRAGGRLVEVGAPAPWKLAVRRKGMRVRGGGRRRR
ncbi:MAG: very short patch repair endonuclease [Acidobacteriota bacterium]|nr:very short patch repair endonuclease [Acidobacteriota bacterium]